jgi:hypothetical protein
MVVTYQYLAVHVNILVQTMVHQIRKKSSALYDGKCNSHTIFKTNNPYPLFTVSTNPLLYIPSQCHKICMLITIKIKL